MKILNIGTVYSFNRVRQNQKDNSTNPFLLRNNLSGDVVSFTAKKYDAEDIYECPICIVESEIHMVQALEDIKKAGCNALCVYLGNFGPEISETLLAKHFEGPKMFVAASEENTQTLASSRGDAYCGMLNASYNLKLRNIKSPFPSLPKRCERYFQIMLMYSERDPRAQAVPSFVKQSGAILFATEE